MKVVFVSGNPEIDPGQDLDTELHGIHEESGICEVRTLLSYNRLSVRAMAWAQRNGVPFKHCDPKWEVGTDILVACHGADADIERAKKAGIAFEKCDS